MALSERGFQNMTLFKRDTTKSASIAIKKKIAGLDDNYRSTRL